MANPDRRDDGDESPDDDRPDNEGKYDKYVDKVLDLLSLF